MTGGSTLNGRSWVTAKGWRALGWPIPDDIADDEVVTPVTAGALPLPAQPRLDLVVAEQQSILEGLRSWRRRRR